MIVKRNGQVAIALVAGLLLLSAAASAQQVMEQVPDDALLVVKVRNMSATSTKVGKVMTDLAINAFVPGIENPLGMLQQKLNLTQGVKNDGDMAIVWRDPEVEGARIVAAAGGERIAVFRDGAQIGALTNLCAHQNGPLGEGRIVDGCVTCPWHGYQYRLDDGCAPPPFTEKLATYRVRLRDGVVEVDPQALPPGTPAAITCPGD
jgi:nitrite reductase/ring-hydroxylating ferredoxin subunit